MKYFVILFVLVFVSIIIPISFAQQIPDCTFGSTITPLSEKFAKDLAVKEFLKQHPNATKSIHTNDSGDPKNQLVLHAVTWVVKETLELHFHIDEKGCYIPLEYHYKYNDGEIDVIVINTIGNFTEIMNLIKLDHKKIDDFYAKNCNPISLDYVLGGDTKPYFCKSDRNSIQMYLQGYVGGPVEIHIPDKTMDALFYNCDLNGDFFVLSNGEEIDYDLIAKQDKRIFKMDLLPGYNKIEIIGFSYLSGTDGFCGSIWSSDSRYISPLLQTKIGVEPWMVKCKEGLTLLLKPAEFTKPACVTGDTVNKLIERNWSISVSRGEKK